MGFMAGFGAAFSESFNQASKQRAQEEQDTFKMMYQDTINQRDKYEEWKREDAKAVRLAKALTEAHGQPPESWTKAHELLRNGASESTVEDFLKSNNLIVGPNTSSRNTGRPSAGAQGEMASGAMGGAAQGGMPADPMQPQEPEGSGFSNLLGGLFDKKQRAQRRRDEAMGKVAQATGMDIGSVQKVLSGKNYESEALAGTEDYSVTIKPKGESDPSKVSNLEEAMTFQVLAQEHYDKTGDDSMLQTANKLLAGQKAASFIKAKDKAVAENLFYEPSGVVLHGPDGPVDYVPAVKNDQDQWVNAQDGTVIEPDGQKIVAIKPMTKRQEEQIEEIYKETGEKADAYTERTLALQGIIRDSKDMQEIVADHPGVLGMGGEVAQWVDRTARNIISVKDLFTDSSGSDIFQTQDSVVTKAFEGAAGTEDDGKNFTADGVSALQDLEDRMLQITGGNIQDESVARALLESKALRMTYAWAATQNQKGRAVSNEEFTNIYNAVMANGNPTAFGMEHKNFIEDIMQNLNSEADMINKHNHLVKKFEDTHGFKPNGIVKTIDEILAESPETLADLNSIINPGGQPEAAPEAQGAAPATENLEPVGTSPAGNPLYRDKATGQIFEDVP